VTRSLSATGFLAFRHSSTWRSQADREGPFALGDGRWMVGEAVLKNRAALAGQLGIGVEAGRLSDAELLSRAVDRWGEAACDRLEGLFAFALWMPGRKRLVLCRDRMGEYTLFYAVGGGAAAFATLPSGLLGLPMVAGEVDETCLARLVMRAPVDQQETLFPEIRQVPPATVVVITPGGVDRRTYWSMDTGRRLRLPAFADYADALREKMREAIAFRLPVDGTGGLGATMSGGLDSTSVTALAAQMLAGEGRSITALTIVPAPDEMNLSARPYDRSEIERAKAVAAAYPNIDHVLVDGAGLPWGAGIDDLQKVAGMPAVFSGRWYAFHPMFNACASRGIGVLLGGQWGNFTFSYGGGEYLRHLVRQRAYGRLLRTAVTLPRRPWGTALDIAMTKMPPGWVAWIRETKARARGMPTRRQRREWMPARDAWLDERGLSRSLPDNELDNPMLGGDPAATLWAQFTGNSQGLGGWLNAAIRAQYGAEYRDPSFDADLWQFCLSIPEDVTHHPRVPRRLVRTAMAGIVPDIVLRQRQRGQLAGAGLHHMSQSLDAVGYSREQMRNSVQASRVFDPDAVDAMIAAIPPAGTQARPEDGRLVDGLGSALSVGSFLHWLERGRPMNGLQETVLEPDPPRESAARPDGGTRPQAVPSCRHG
jgi:asparagine synthase (glutamine-hydrolysing)